MEGFLLVILPAFALGRKDMNVVATFGEFSVEHQDGRGNAVDFRIKRIGKQADFHISALQNRG